MIRFPLILCPALLVAVPSLSQADPRFEVTWRTVDDGGDMFSESSPSGRFELSGTIGQPDIGTLCSERFTLAGGFWGSFPPRPDPAPSPPDTGFGTKNRYMTFAGGYPGRSQAVHVTFASMPYYDGCEPPESCDFTYADGRTSWIQSPFLVTEASDSDGPTPPPSFPAAELGCEPHCRDWSEGSCVDGSCVGGLLGGQRWPCTFDDECRRVDVFDAGIIPEGTYEIRLVDDACSPGACRTFSDPLEVRMSEAGDVVGNDLTPPASAPQGIVNFNDIAAVVSKFKNEPDAIRKARADIVGNGPADPLPNRKVDFVDISCVVGAFSAEPCVPVGPPVDDPCP